MTGATNICATPTVPSEDNACLDQVRACTATPLATLLQLLSIWMFGLNQIVSNLTGPFVPRLATLLNDIDKLFEVPNRPVPANPHSCYCLISPRCRLLHKVAAPPWDIMTEMHRFTSLFLFYSSKINCSQKGHFKSQPRLGEERSSTKPTKPQKNENMHSPINPMNK